MYHCTNASCGKPHSATSRSLCKTCFDESRGVHTNNITSTNSPTHSHDVQSYGTTYNAFSTSGSNTHTTNTTGRHSLNNNTLSQHQQLHQRTQHSPIGTPGMGSNMADWVPGEDDTNTYWENMNKLLNLKLNNLKDSIMTEVKQITEPIVRDVTDLQKENAQLKEDFASLKTKTKEELDKAKAASNLKIARLEEKNNRMCQIMKNHQLTIDSVEFEKRGCNIIIRGIQEEDPPSEEADKGAVQAVFERIGAVLDPLPDAKRLGKLDARNKFHRALLIQCDNKAEVDGIIEKAKQLGDLPETDPAKKVFIQRDLPPNIREGNYRLRQQLKVEKAKMENAGTELKLDYKKGTISRMVGDDDEVVIFNSQHPF